MKDLHAQLLAYANDHENTLPGGNISDFAGVFPSGSGSTHGMYANWNGHLIPYIHPEMDQTKWTKRIMIKYDSKWYGNWNNLLPDDAPNLDIMKSALVGQGVFRIFYCPEVIASISDPGLHYVAGAKGKLFLEPKMFSLTSYYVTYGMSFTRSDYSPDGIPTTYIANDDLMNPDDPKSLSQLKNFGKKYC